MAQNVKELIKALCIEFQSGYPQPRNAQECIDVANSVLQSAMLEFVNDRVVQSSIGVATQNGFRINLAFTDEGEAEDGEDEELPQ
jgi:hypothetical protein